jgi:uncharacterized membrane protein YgdD (TMEM256/DUF423 family)
MSQFLIILAGACGAIGVALAAASAHGGDAAALGPASQMLLVHAPALLALGLYGRASGHLPRGFAWGGAALALGAALFAGAVAGRHFLGQPPFPMAAPTGGTLMMAGWFVILVAGALLARPRLG